MTDNKKKRHIVMVDDEPVNLELAENALKDIYKLTKLISGVQLLTFLTRVKPDMILLDVQMPEMTGYEVMEKIANDPSTKNIPVIFLTGQDSPESEKKGFSLGAKDFIRKPFDNEIMLARISSQMELAQYRTGLEEIITKKTLELLDLQTTFIISCAELIETRDGTTGSHVRSTRAYFEILIKHMATLPEYEKEFTAENVRLIIKASMLHDMGKIGVSDIILKKPEALTSTEFEEMKKHCQMGVDILDRILLQTSYDDFLKFAKDMAYSHHEHFDGSGYPEGLKGDEIPVYVRALSIVDEYDALTSARPYKKPFSHEEAIQSLIAKSGRHFDPKIFDIFLSLEEKFKGQEK